MECSGFNPASWTFHATALVGANGFFVLLSSTNSIYTDLLAPAVNKHK